MFTVKLKKDLSKYNYLFVEGAIGKSNLRQYRRSHWMWLKFVDVVIDGQHLDVVDNWKSMEIIDDAYWIKLLEDLRRSKEIVLTVNENGSSIKLAYDQTCISWDEWKVRKIINLCERNNIFYQIAI
jgi:hypothetical protein